MKTEITYHQKGKDPYYKIWHTAGEHLLLYFHSDGGSLVCADAVFPIKKGGLVFIAADTYHYTMPDEPARYDRSKLHFSRDALDKIRSLSDERDGFEVFADNGIVYAELTEEAQKKVDALFLEADRVRMREERELLLLCCAIKLLLYLKKYSKASTASATGLVGKAMEYINKNISFAIGIDDICAAVNISKYHFCRLFKQQTGMTVMKYILKTRITLAKNDLKKTNVSVSEISEAYGFSSVSYFSRVFKEEEHCSPLQYRKQKGARPLY